MTEIPFIDRLGDAIDAAIAVPESRRAHWRLRRAPLVLAMVVAALAIAAIAIAHVLSNPDELAANSVACYTSADLSSNVTVVANDRAPVAACADAYRRMGQKVPPLVACANASSVAVVPGSDESACVRLGLHSLPAGYAASRAKTKRFAEAVLALERARDCVAPGDLAGSVQRLLDREGWVGWKVEVRSPIGGPCGSVTTLDGSGQRRLDGALDAGRRVVFVSGAASRSTMTVLYGPRGLARSLEDVSGVRCFTINALTALVRSRAASVGRSGSVELAQAIPSTVTFADVREARYRAGCAIVTDVRAAPDGRNIVAISPKAPGH